MNKYQEALDEIKNYRIHQGLHDLLHIGKLLKKQTDILQELADKTIPKEPLNIYYGLTEQEGICPSCNKKIFEPLMELAYSKDDDLEYFTEVKLSNCNRCGQALKWK